MKNKTLLVLAINAFAIGMCEFISVGLLPLIANDFKIGVTMASLSVSLYALGVTISAPILTTLTSKINRKTLMLLLVINFIVGNFISFIAPNIYILIFGRIISSFSHAIFMSISTLIASQVVSKDKQASAIAIMFSGLTIATISGVPLGTQIGQMFNWRMSFLFIMIFGVMSLILDYIFLPNNLQNPPIIKLKDHIKLLKSPKLLLMFLITALGYGSTFVVYTFITTILNTVTHFTAQQIVLILVVYGIFIAIGNTLGGKFANKKPLKALIIMFAVQAVVLLLFTISAHNQIFALINVVLLGLFGFMNVPGLQLFVLELGKKYTPKILEIVSAYNISAFNIGISAGSIIGSITLAHFNLLSLPVVAFIIAVIAMLLAMGLNKLEK